MLKFGPKSGLKDNFRPKSLNNGAAHQLTTLNLYRSVMKVVY